MNDATMTRELHLGPYQGRDADLVDVVGGVLCNPMTQAARVAGPARDRDGVPPRSRRATTPAAAWAARVADRRRRARGAAGGARARVRRRPADRAPGRLDLAAPGRPARGRARRARLGRRRRRIWPPSSARPGPCPRRFPPGERRRRRSAPRSRRGPRRPGAHAAAGLAALRLIQQVRPVLRGRGRPAAPTRRSRPIPSRRCTTPSHSSMHGWARVPMNTLCTVRVSPSTRRSSSCPTGGAGPRRPVVAARGRQRDRPAVPARARRLRGAGGASRMRFASRRRARSRSAIADWPEREPNHEADDGAHRSRRRRPRRSWDR